MPFGIMLSAKESYSSLNIRLSKDRTDNHQESGVLTDWMYPIYGTPNAVNNV